MPSTTLILTLTMLLGGGLLTPGAQESGESAARKGAGRPAEDESDASSLRMSKAVACRSIDGYERFERLPDASLTKDEKLLVYYRPLNYKTVKENAKFRVHLTQDGQIRRQGEKAVLRRKAKILDYQPIMSYEPEWIFLKNSVPLKGLPPGDYEYDIILRDENTSGAPVVQTLKFRIVPAQLPEGRNENSSEPEPSAQFLDAPRRGS